MRVGVYVCHCGINIAKTVDVERVVKEISKMPNVVICRDYHYMCSDPGQELIKKDINRYGLNSIVIAACSPRMHFKTFQEALKSAKLNPYMLEMANIREQCSWVHDDVEEATKKAIALVKSAVAKAAQLEPLVENDSPVVPAALVIGGGIAGIQSALDIANAGFKVYLVEREPSIGGHMAQFDKTFPTLDCAACILTPKMVDVSRHRKIELLAYSEVDDVTGFIGNFHVKVRRKPRYVDEERCVACGDCATECRLFNRIDSEFDEGLGKRAAIYVPFPQAVPLKYTIDPERCLFLTRGKCGDSPKCVDVCDANAIEFDQEGRTVEFDVGTIVVATGYDSFDATKKPELMYDKLPNVINGLQYERFFAPNGPTGGELVMPDGTVPKKVVFVSCVGSRDKKVGNPYCSRICCMYSTKQAHLTKERVPDADVTVFYCDVRAFGKGYEEFYERVQEEGVKYRRGLVSEIYRDDDGKVHVRAEDTLLGEPIDLEADLVVLATGIVPKATTRSLAQKLHISHSPDGFLLEAHPKLRPVDTVTDGIFLAGCAQGPKDIPDTVAQAGAAAAHAIDILAKGKITIEPYNAVVNPDLCGGCRICEMLCPFDAHHYNEAKGVMEINDTLCKGCGVCGAGCPAGAITLNLFRNKQIICQIGAILDE
ncbi:MAG TPA: CoB--CoM heterodisulfide reductase iron-sulfur subunit A family protein [Candidatus Methanofastidiosa archaeon]|nr:CoB--CoM heterodisulfide reductase iron-sulfur subunit A family protein [Candidatus Methanofastidiosa archaeon]